MTEKQVRLFYVACALRNLQLDDEVAVEAMRIAVEYAYTGLYTNWMLRTFRVLENRDHRTAEVSLLIEALRWPEPRHVNFDCPHKRSLYRCVCSEADYRGVATPEMRTLAMAANGDDSLAYAALADCMLEAGGSPSHPYIVHLREPVHARGCHVIEAVLNARTY